MTTLDARGFFVPQARSRAADVARPKRWTKDWIAFLVVMASWCFVPLVRRLLDYHNGFYNPIQITSVIPFLLTLALAIPAFQPAALKRLSPAFRIFAWVWLGSFAYGFLIAVVGGNLFAGAYSAVQFTAPMVVGIWLAGRDIDNAELARRVSGIVLVFAGIVAVYGLVQFVAPPPWDALWVIGGEFGSMGAPVPFGLRVFSTLNSSGPAADFFDLAIILALPLLGISLRKIWLWPLVTALGAALLLTLVRASWVGLVVGVVVYLVASPRRVRAVPFIAVIGIVLTLLVVSLPALLGDTRNSDVVTSRLSTLTDVGHDASALARTQEIGDAIDQGLQNPVGDGLGTLGASSALSNNPTSIQGNNLDSGYLSRFLELGWLGFTGYLFVVVGGFAFMFFTAFRRDVSAETKVFVAMAAAMCAMLVWVDAAGDSHLGLDGLFFWIAMGIGLRRVVALPTVRAQ
jgi:hypothetical protein